MACPQGTLAAEVPIGAGKSALMGLDRSWTSRARGIGLAGALLAAAPDAIASGNHHSAPMGGRSALMGGTGVALGVDGAAPFLNPATLTRIGAARLAFSSRFYRFSHSTLHDFYQPGPIDPSLGVGRFGDTSVSRSRIHSMPDSACYFFPSVPELLSWRQRLSLCLARTEEQELSLRALAFRDGTDAVRVDQSQLFDIDWSRFHLGPTWGVLATEQLSLGVSLLVAFTRYQHAVVASTIVEDTASGAASVSSYESVVSAFSWDVAPRVGVNYRVLEPLWVGASATLPLAHLLGGIRESYLNELDAARTQWSGDGEFSAKPPFQVSLGAGVEWNAARIELDAFLTLSTDAYARGELDRRTVRVEAGQVTSRDTAVVRVTEESETVLNVAVGAEFFVAQRLSLLAGAQTDRNALPGSAPQAGGLFRTRLDYYRAGVGLASYTDFGDLIVGLRFDYGTGGAAPVNAFAVPPALGHSDVSELGVMLVLAGSIDWRTLTEAAEHVGDVVRGKAPRPRGTPPSPLQSPEERKR